MEILDKHVCIQLATLANYLCISGSCLAAAHRFCTVVYKKKQQEKQSLQKQEFDLPPDIHKTPTNIL